MSITDELSIQLYSLRGYGDLDRQLAALAEIGFRRVETVGGHLADAAATRRSLEAHGLTAPTGHVGLDDLRTRLEDVLDGAREIGHEALFMPAVPPQDRDGTADAWRALGAELGALAQRMGEAGLALGYHNHDWELRTFGDGTTPLQHLFAGAAGSPLGFEADLAWLARGGADPLAWMRTATARLTAIHVKDLAPDGANSDEDGWADVGKGTLDWPTLLAAARGHGVRWLVLEHDKPSDPIRFARDSRAYLVRTFG